MTSQKQIDANRANAQRSTGPRTADGKAVSAQNSVKHGVLSQKAISRYEDRSAYDELVGQLAADIRPATALEDALVQRLAILIWRERRLGHAEAELFTQQHDDAQEGVFSSYQRYVPLPDQFLIGRYQTMLGRQIRDTLRDLRDEQERRMQTIDQVLGVSLESEV